MQGGYSRRIAKEAARFSPGEAGQLDSFKVCRVPVCSLYQRQETGRRLHRKTESEMDRRLKFLLEPLVINADRRFEGAYQVANYIFWCIVKERHHAQLTTAPGVELLQQKLDKQAVLGHREGMLAARLAVPAGNPGEPVCNVLNFDVERRRIKKVKSPSAQHPLPCPTRGVRFCHQVLPM